MTTLAFTRKLFKASRGLGACPRRGVAEDAQAAGARGGENDGGCTTIRLGNKPPLFIFMKEGLNYLQKIP
jgi:hypothetical protein